MASLLPVLCLLGFAFVTAQASVCTSIFPGVGCLPLSSSCPSKKAVVSTALCPSNTEKCCVPSTVLQCLKGIACSGRPEGEVGKINGTPVCCPPNTGPGFIFVGGICLCK